MDYKRSNATTIKYCLAVGLGAILFGFDQGALTGLLAMSRFLQDFGYYDPKLKGYNMTAGDQTLMWGVALGCAILACVIAGPLGSRYGRRAGLTVCAVVSIVGPLFQAVSTNFGIMVFGRGLSGAGIGFAANFCIQYWAETTPAHLRGMVVMIYQAFINVAQFVSACINQGTHDWTTKWAWRTPLLVMMIPPILLLACMPFIPDTPRWFVQRGREGDAHKAMAKLRGDTWPEDDINKEIHDIVAMEKIEQELEGQSNYIDCFRGIDLRRTLIVITVLVCQQFTGISFITAFGTYFFLVTGIANPFTITVITSVCGILGSASAFPLVKYFGRRPILITGAAVQALAMLTFAIVGTVAPGSNAAAKCEVAFVCLFIFTYGATWGPVPQAVLGEIPTNRLRSKTMSMATSVNWTCTTFIVCGMPYILSDSYANLGAKVGFIFGACTTLSTFWTFFCLPETRDRTLEEIDEMFLNHIPTRKFKTYVCTGQASNLSMDKVLGDFELDADKKGFTGVDTLEVASSSSH